MPPEGALMSPEPDSTFTFTFTFTFTPESDSVVCFEELLVVAWVSSAGFTEVDTLFRVGLVVGTSLLSDGSLLSMF